MERTSIGRNSPAKGSSPNVTKNFYKSNLFEKKKKVTFLTNAPNGSFISQNSNLKLLIAQSTPVPSSQLNNSGPPNDENDVVSFLRDFFVEIC